MGKKKSGARAAPKAAAAPPSEAVVANGADHLKAVVEPVPSKLFPGCYAAFEGCIGAALRCHLPHVRLALPHTLVLREQVCIC